MMTPEHPLIAELGPQIRPVNRQLYENNPLADDPLTQEYLDSATRFGGEDRGPNLAIQTEKVEHRVIMYLRAQGKSMREIANVTGYTYIWVTQVCRQPWFKKRLLETISAAGEDGVSAFVKGEILPSLVALSEIRDDPEAKNSDRIAAVNSILNRGLGMPTQHIKTEKVESADALTQEMADIERQLAEIKRQQVGMLPTSVASNSGEN